MRIIDIRAYRTDPIARELADELMARFGFDRNDVDEINYDDEIVEFHTIDREPRSGEWVKCFR